MEKSCGLDRVPVGTAARILEVGGTESEARRLQELGFAPGGRVEVLFESPWGDPVAYYVRGAVVALRRRDAGTILVDCLE